MKKVLALMAVIVLVAANLYAGNGDLIVNGKLGVGTPSPGARFDVTGHAIFGNSPGVIGTNQVVGIQSNENVPALLVGGNGITGQSKGIKVMSGLNSSDYAMDIQNYNGATFMYVRGDGNVGIGTTTPDHTLTVAGTTWTSAGYLQLSDIKLKKNILPVDSALDKILKLNGVSYEWKHGKDFEGETLEALKIDEDGKIKDDKYRDLPGGRTLGVIAQELEKVLPEAVNTGEDGIKAVSYTKIIPVLIEAVKEQQKQITAQIDKNKDQQKRIEELEKKVSQLK